MANRSCRRREFVETQLVTLCKASISVIPTVATNDTREVVPGAIEQILGYFDQEQRRLWHVDKRLIRTSALFLYVTAIDLVYKRYTPIDTKYDIRNQCRSSAG